MTQQVAFKLKCVGCGAIEKRPAADCRGEDPPFCSKCFMPMVLMAIKNETRKKAK